MKYPSGDAFPVFTYADQTPPDHWRFLPRFRFAAKNSSHTLQGAAAIITLSLLEDLGNKHVVEIPGTLKELDRLMRLQITVHVTGEHLAEMARVETLLGLARSRDVGDREI